MFKMVDGTGIIGVDMVCPLGVSAPQPPNYDRVELEGTGMLVLPNSLDAPLERLELGGKTEQVSTRGVNLWSKESKITFTATKQVVFDTPIPAGDYVVSANVTSNDKDGAVCLMLFYYTDSGSKGANLTRAGRASAKITFTSDVKHVVLYAGQNANGSANDTATFADIQLEKGSTATAYEPYTGGKPSPSPEYLQEIKNSGKWNEKTQKYEVDVKVCNSGYLQKGSYADKIRAFPLEKGKTYRIYVNVNSAVVNTGILDEETTFNHASTLYAYCNKPEYPINNTGIISGKCKIPNNLSRGYTFTVTVDGLFLYQGVNAVSLNTDDAYIAYDFIKTVDMTSPYTEKDPLTITSDRPLTKWDRLVEQGGEIGWLYAGVVIDRFDGQSNKISIANKQGNVQNFSIRFENVANGNGNSDIFVDKYRAVQLSYVKAEYGICCNWNDGVKYFSAPNENVATVDEFKAWLIENPLKIAYETTNPEFIPLPQSEQNAIRTLKTYYPTTVITADGGELDPDIKVTYRKEI
jgi:hypothetical protein